MRILVGTNQVGESSIFLSNTGIAIKEDGELRMEQQSGYSFAYWDGDFMLSNDGKSVSLILEDEESKKSFTWLKRKRKYNQVSDLYVNRINIVDVSGSILASVFGTVNPE